MWPHDRACAHPTGYTIMSVVWLLYGKWKTTTRFPFSIMLPVLNSNIKWKIISITAATIWWTDWPQEPTLCVVINSHIENWILNFGQIVPLSESSCNFVWIFQNAFQMSIIYLGICDLEYYNCIAVLSMCLKRKMDCVSESLWFRNHDLRI